MSIHIDQKDKLELKERIDNSINQIRRKRKHKRNVYFLSASAAILLFLIGFNLSFTGENIETSLKNSIVVNKTELSKGGSVKLQVNDDEVVHLAHKQPKLVYSSSGALELKVNDSIVHKSFVTEIKPKINVLMVPFGKSTYLTLSDGTKVWINSGTKLSYPSFFNESSRNVFLEGEAIFEVAHNKEKPFFVHTENSKIKVLGTVFNVSSYSDDITNNVALQSGSVEVEYDKSGLFSKNVIKRLTPGMISTYDKTTEKIELSTANIDDIMSWKNGVLIFKNEPLDRIVKKIARYYNVTINVDKNNVLNKTFSGSLHVKKTVEEIMEVVGQTANIKYEIVFKE